jgi:hypothetical protein
MMNTKRKSKNTPKKSDPPPATASGTEELVIDLFLTDALLCLGGGAGVCFDALAAWVALAVGGGACLAAFERRAAGPTVFLTIVVAAKGNSNAFVEELPDPEQD